MIVINLNFKKIKVVVMPINFNLDKISVRATWL